MAPDRENTYMNIQIMFEIQTRQLVGNSHSTLETGFNVIKLLLMTNTRHYYHFFCTYQTEPDWLMSQQVQSLLDSDICCPIVSYELHPHGNRSDLVHQVHSQPHLYTGVLKVTKTCHEDLFLYTFCQVHVYICKLHCN